jgi:quercetin dioxygenase-like cupin family protein
MRATIVPIIALIAVAGCRDAAATSPTGATPSRSDSRSSASADVVLPPVGGFVSTPLSRGSFPDAIDATFRIKEDHGATTVVHVDDPTQMVMAKITIAPHSALPWHTHPGPALVTVAAGELTLVDGDSCTTHPYAAGSSFMDAGQGHVHTAYNAQDVEMTLYVTYLDVPVGASPLVPVANPGC